MASDKNWTNNYIQQHYCTQMRITYVNRNPSTFNLKV